jgi:hypothetical protein
VRLERAQRVCRLCASGEVKDETHMIFRCSFPHLASLRALHPTLFSLFPQPLEAGALRRFLKQPPARGLLVIYICMYIYIYIYIYIYSGIKHIYIVCASLVSLCNAVRHL